MSGNEEEVAVAQDSEVQRAMKSLLHALTEVRNQQANSPISTWTMRKQGTIEGLNIAIAAIKRRIR